MQLFIEEYTSASFILTALLQQIFWHSPFKLPYLARPIIEEYSWGTEFWPMDRYHRLNMNRWIDGHRSDKDFVIDDRYNRSKGKNLRPMDPYYRWSAWPIISIDSISINPSIHRWLCPTMVACQILGRIQQAQNTMTTSLCRSRNTSSLNIGMKISETSSFLLILYVCLWAHLAHIFGYADLLKQILQWT
jgi:hypothetical protein